MNSRRLGHQLELPEPSAALDRNALKNLKDALLRHKVLILRGRDVDEAAHRRFLRRLGTLEDPALPNAEVWLAPGSDRLAPPKAISVLASDATGPLRLGFADVAAAYRAVPHPLRTLADRSWAVHGNQERVAHPVARLHPETGDRGLLLGSLPRQVLGLTDDEGRTVLELLQSYVTEPHNVVELECAPGTLVLADARAIQVRLPAPTRLLTLAGEPPLGVNGQHSHLLPHPSVTAALGTRIS
jgi:taurine dioxygenase